MKMKFQNFKSVKQDSKVEKVSDLRKHPVQRLSVTFSITYTLRALVVSCSFELSFETKCARNLSVRFEETSRQETKC